MSRQRPIGLLTFRCYLLFAFALVIVKVVEVAIGRWVLTSKIRPAPGS
jgi:hypothetical protein